MTSIARTGRHGPLLYGCEYQKASQRELLLAQYTTVNSFTCLLDFLVCCGNLASLGLAIQLAMKEKFLPFDGLLQAVFEFHCILDSEVLWVGCLEFGSS